jgi:hypothetical protein
MTPRAFENKGTHVASISGLRITGTAGFDKLRAVLPDPFVEVL